MGIINNYKEQKAELKRIRKERKLLKKSQEPIEKRLTRNITTIVFTLLLIFGCTINPILSLLNYSGGPNLNGFEVITNEYSEKLNAEVNVDNLIKVRRLNDNDYQNVYNNLTSHNIDIFKDDKTLDQNKVGSFTKVINQDISLSGYEIGAFINALFTTSDTNVSIGDNQSDISINTVEVLELSIYEENSTTHMYSVISIPLNDLFDRTDLPDIYLSTDTSFTIQNGDIVISDSKSRINELNDEDNTSLLNILNALLSYAEISAHSINTTIIMSTLKDFATNLHAVLSKDNLNIVLTPKTY